jgi:hypothetical protein
MYLPNDLISKFVKITKDDKKTKTETTVYGTIVDSDGKKYVRFDGAEQNQITPVVMTVDAEDGERVSVLLKDHVATVTGNLTSPAVRTDTVKDAMKDIEEGGKTAKNFMEFDPYDGLQVGNKTSGVWSGFRAQIKDGEYNILDAAGKVVASYGEKLIELGKNAVDAVINLCGGKGRIDYVTDADDNTDYIQVSSDRVRLKSSKMSSLYSMFTDNSTRWEKSAVNVTPNKIEIYASECIDPGAPEHVNSWQTTKATIESGNVAIDTPGSMRFNCEGVYDRQGKLVSVERGSSGIWNYSKWSDGTVELWGAYDVLDVNCIGALGSMFRTEALQPDDFPFLVYNPQLVASYETTGYGAILWATTKTTASSPPSYYLLRPVSGTIVYGQIIFHVTGTWV